MDAALGRLGCCLLAQGSAGIDNEIAAALAAGVPVGAVKAAAAMARVAPSLCGLLARCDEAEMGDEIVEMLVKDAAAKYPRLATEVKAANIFNRIGNAVSGTGGLFSSAGNVANTITGLPGRAMANVNRYGTAVNQAGGVVTGRTPTSGNLLQRTGQRFSQAGNAANQLGGAVQDTGQILSDTQQAGQDVINMPSRVGQNVQQYRNI
jgi:hypothetical protein